MKFWLSLNSILIGIYFVPVLYSQTYTKEYTSYMRYPLCKPSDDIRHPTSATAVASIVNEAIRRKTTVKAFGKRHSQTDIICTEGIPVDMQGLKSFKLNKDNTATFGAGVSAFEAGEFLRNHGRALGILAAFGNITLGGAVGTGAHGSSIKHHSSISAQVARLTIVNGNGKIEVISNAEDLKSFQVHLGLLGIIVDVTLYTLPLYKVNAHNYATSDDVLTNGVAINWVKNADQIMFVWWPLFNEVVVMNYTFVPANTAGEAWSNFVPSTAYESNVFNSLYGETAFGLGTSECAEASAFGYEMLHVLEMVSEPTPYTAYPGNTFYTDNGTDFVNPAVGYPHQMLTSTCREDAGPENVGCAWSHGNVSLDILDNELGFPLTDLATVINIIKDIVKKAPVTYTMGYLMRFSGANDIYMSTAYKRDTVHLESIMTKRTDPYNNASANLVGLQTVLQILAKQFKGRSHWGKSGLVYHNREMLDLKLDPSARQKFIATMLKFDPNGIFINNFGRRLIRKGTKVDIDPKTTRCALLDNCFCTNDSECAATQICTSVSGYNNYRGCQTKNISLAGTHFNRSAYDATFNIANFFINTVPQRILSFKCN